MNQVDLSIIWPALLAGVLVSATHVPLGMQVLKRGIVFIDLAIAQIAGLGVIAAHTFEWAESAAMLQVAALATALAGALLLTWTERRFAEVQEAIIGVTFVLAASAEVILLASNPHGAEHMKDILVGQILWIDAKHLLLVALVYVGVLALWFGAGDKLGRIGFYLMFAVCVTVSVQMVGLYLVFTTLIVPALGARKLARPMPWAYAIALLGYAMGLLVCSVLDLPAGPTIVLTMVAIGIAAHALSRRPV